MAKIRIPSHFVLLLLKKHFRSRCRRIRKKAINRSHSHSLLHTGIRPEKNHIITLFNYLRPSTVTGVKKPTPTSILTKPFSIVKARPPSKPQTPILRPISADRTCRGRVEEIWVFINRAICKEREMMLMLMLMLVLMLMMMILKLKLIYKITSCSNSSSIGVVKRFGIIVVIGRCDEKFIIWVWKRMIWKWNFKRWEIEFMS